MLFYGMVNNYISVYQIMDDLLDHPLMRDLTFERAINYAIQFIRIVGCPNMFIEKTDVIKIEDYKGLLPCALDNIIQVRDCNSGKTFRYSSDSFHHSKDKSNSYDLTYKIQNSIIFTSIKEGTIEIAYTAVATDNEGFPLIPDDSAFIRALQLYVKKQYFTILFDLGKITLQSLQNTQQEYGFAVGAAASSLTIPSIDQMESITNSWNTLIQRTTQHKTGFINNGVQEKIRLH